MNRPKSIRLDLSINDEALAIAAIIRILQTYWSGNVQKVLNTVAAYFGYRVVV